MRPKKVEAPALRYRFRKNMGREVRGDVHRDIEWADVVDRVVNRPHDELRRG
jgi:hypothetical protein